MGKKVQEGPVPDDMKEDVEIYRKQLEEAIVEANDDMMEKYLEGAEFTQEELMKGLRKAVVDNMVIPVLCGSAFKNKGVQPLLDAIIDLLPSPLDKAAINGILPNAKKPLVNQTLKHHSAR